MTVINGNETISLSKVVGRGGLLRGVGSRKVVLSADNSSINPVVRVQDTVFEEEAKSFGLDAFAESEVIENLIIDGGNFPGVTGILLENVCQCLIRNVTIRNCEVGIHIRDVEGLWSEGNTLKHIRMENVKKGIVFTTTGKDSDPRPGNSAAFTTIEDVDIGLADVSDAVGIQIGGKQIVNNPNPLLNDLDTVKTLNSIKCPVFMDPYSSFIRVRVRLGSQGGTGLKVINGFLHFAQAHLTVIGHVNGSGVGIDLREAHNYKTILEGQSTIFNKLYPPKYIENMFVFYSQFTKLASNGAVSFGGFMLVTSNILSQNRILRDPADTTKLDIQVKSIT